VAERIYRPCPGCLHFDEIEVITNQYHAVYVQCHKPGCCVRGPAGRNRGEAVEGWNNMGCWVRQKEEKEIQFRNIAERLQRFIDTFYEERE